MAKRIGKQTILLPSRPVILASAAVGTQKEEKGPLGERFDHIFKDATLGTPNWEQAESALQRAAVERALDKASLSPRQVQLILAGDLQGQCTASAFGIRGLPIPFAGVYGACSTMALTLAMAGILTDCGAAETAVACTSSHFCAAEKQFRMPLEYGGQRTPTAQWTATAAGAAVIGKAGEGPRLEAAVFGSIEDLGVKDSTNMGAAMAPAACGTIAAFLRDTGTSPQDYDMILTGDLGFVGSKLLIELMEREHGIHIQRVHADCGMLLYDRGKQDVHAGGSGCGCSAAVVCGDIMRRLRERSLRRVLFVATGALLSTVSVKQGASIPGIAHGVLLTSGEETA